MVFHTGGYGHRGAYASCGSVYVGTCLAATYLLAAEAPSDSRGALCCFSVVHLCICGAYTSVHMPSCTGHPARPATTQLEVLHSVLITFLTHCLTCACPACTHPAQAKCVGPARNTSAERLQLAWKQASSQFARDYNDRLFTGLLLAGVGSIVLFRFIIRIGPLEAAGWVSVVFLEVYPHVWGGSGHMYDTHWWKLTTQAWEWVMWALFTAGGLVLWLGLAVLGLLCWQRLRQKRMARKKTVLTSRQGDVRDLDV